MSELGREARALLRVARQDERMPAGDRQRLRNQVMRRVGVIAGAAGAGGAVAGASTTAAAAAAPLAAKAAAVGSTLVGKVLLSCALVAGAGTTVLAVDAARAPEAPVAAAQRPAARAGAELRDIGRLAAAAVTAAAVAPDAADVAAPVPPAPTETSSATATPTSTSSPTPTATATATGAAARANAPSRTPRAAAEASPGIADEVRALREARDALQSGDHERALRLLDATATGALEEERAAMRAITLCDAGRDAEGRAAAERFLQRWSASPLRERVRARCLP
jgi:hypothetical protein